MINLVNSSVLRSRYFLTLAALVLGGTLVIYGADKLMSWYFARQAAREVSEKASLTPMPLVAECLDKGLVQAMYNSDLGNLPMDEIFHVYRDPDGVIWATGTRGLFIFDGEAFKAVDVEKSFESYSLGLQATALWGEGGGVLYIHYAGLGLCSYNRNTKEMVFLAPSGDEIPYLPRTSILKVGNKVYYSSGPSYSIVYVHDLHSGMTDTLGRRVSGSLMAGPETGTVIFYSYFDFSADSCNMVVYRDTQLIETRFYPVFGFEHSLAISPDSILCFSRNRPRIFLHVLSSDVIQPLEMPVNADSSEFRLGTIVNATYDPVHREVYLAFWRGVSILDPFTWRSVSYDFPGRDSRRFRPAFTPVTSVTRDFFGNLWMGFYGQGIARVEVTNSLMRNYFTEAELGKDNKLSVNNLVQHKDGEIILITGDGLVVADSAFGNHRVVKDVDIPGVTCNANWFTNLQAIDDSTYMVGSWGNPPTLFRNSEGEWHFLPQRHSRLGTNQCGTFNRDIFRWGDYWLFSSWGAFDAIHAANINGTRYFRYVRDFEGQKMAPFNLTTGSLLVGDELWMSFSNSGVSRLKLGDVPDPSDEHGDTLNMHFSPLPFPGDSSVIRELTKSGVLRMLELSDGRICILASSGLFVRDEGMFEKQHLPALVDKVLQTMAVDPRTGDILVGTSQGLFRFSGDLSELKQVLDTRHGMLSPSVIGIYFLNDGRMVVNTKAGLSVAGDRFHSSMLPSVLVDQVFFNGDAAIPSGNVYRSAPGINQLSVSLFTTQYHSRAKSRIRYSLNEGHSWTDAKDARALLLTLPSGRHQLQVAALTLDGQQAGPATTLYIEMPAPWYATWWFRFLIVSILLAAVASYFRERRLARYRADKMQDTIRFLRLQTIHAQMNPHFIFNTLGTMQYFILNNDALSANRLLVKLSRLIRNYLDASVKSSYGETGLMQNEISLRQELDLVSDYMDFERIQLNQSFEFITEIDEEISPDSVSLPPMLIQPFLENAVKHGVAYRESGGEVRLKVSQNEQGLLISIRDNGIGRHASRIRQEESLKSYKSYGTDLVQRKVDLLNQLGYHISISYTDLDPGLEVQVFIQN